MTPAILRDQEPDQEDKFFDEVSKNLEVRLLYSQRLSKDSPSKVSFHSHPFWQLEIILKGPITVATKILKKEMQKGDAVLIPPHIPHGFIYKDAENEFLTIRFKTKQELPIEQAKILNPTNLTTPLNLCLTNMVPFQGNMIQHEKIVTEKIIGVYLSIFLLSKNNLIGISSKNILQSIKQIVLQNGGRSITIEEISKKMGYSNSYISSFFKKEEGVSLKNYIDHERFLVAKKMLLYSDFDISKISELLDFPEINSFSRFIRKHSGKSPRNFRKQYF